MAEEVCWLKAMDGGDIFVFGSADLTATLIENDLVDEYRIGINPIILGGGMPLFRGSDKRRKLRLLKARTLKTGVVILHYAPEGSQ
ncbi:dihydrofolate reductase family protein [Chelativorans sp. Marseille-P2723]|uniref:dihydrofolate reductase family protein n=1 Tax=Chelativorans sp. Marseille-P2723 TaxID=2709133 RepID=UPI00156F9A1A|nr:dihydrofolate reductase family protein [Chelativorans sp. Marseille-P2723]